MRKIFLFLFAFCCISLVSCEELRTGTSLLPSSSGGHDEVLTIVDLAFWHEQLNDSVTHYLMSDFPAIPQSEPALHVSRVGYDDFNDFFKRFRNILFIGALDDGTRIAEFMKGVMGEENLQKAETQPGFYYVMQRNVWAQPQFIVYLFAPDRETLLDNLRNHHQRIIALFMKEELSKYRDAIYAFGENKEIMNRLASDFGIRLRIPAHYFIAIEEENFIWLRRETDETSANIMIYSAPFDKSDLSGNPAITWRDTLGKRYISSAIEGSYMVSNDFVPFLQKEMMLNEHPAYESRGLWRMENDFMGGPFINYFIHDKEEGRAIMLDGFVHSPSTPKKKEVRGLEAIFSTFSREVVR